MYIKREYYAGQTIDVYKIKTFKHEKGSKRNPKQVPTPEIIRKQNALIAKDKLTRKLNANFTNDDFHMVVTFFKEKRPTFEEIKNIHKKILRKARIEYKKVGLEFKYVSTYGYLPKDGVDYDYDSHNETVPHFHFIVNHIDIRVWTKMLKEYGRPMFFPLDERGDYSQLGSYFINHTINNFRDENSPIKQMYSCSRNLITPQAKEKVIGAENWRNDPVAQKGYIVDKNSVRIGVSAVTGYPYQFYRMIKVKANI